MSGVLRGVGRSSTRSQSFLVCDTMLHSCQRVGPMVLFVSSCKITRRSLALPTAHLALLGSRFQSRAHVGEGVRAEIPDPASTIRYDYTFSCGQTGSNTCPPLCCHPCVRYWACRCPEGWHCESRLRFHVPSSCHRGQVHERGLALQIQVTISRSKFSPPTGRTTPLGGKK